MRTDYRAPNRPAPTIAQRCNPLWWALDTERPANQSAIGWFFRNPFCNFLSVVVGIAHRHRVVRVVRGVGWTFCDGVNCGYSTTQGGLIPLPFISFRALGMEGMVGWKTSGGLGMSLRKAFAKGPQ